MSSREATRSDLPRALSVQGSVLRALILRELQTRFGRENVGFLWLIGEPLMLASVISVVHALSGGSHGGDMHPGVFSLLGYCMFIIFRGVFQKAEGLVEQNIMLLFHKSVTILDIMVARALTELAGCFGAYCVLLIIFIIVGMAHLPARPLYLLAGFGLSTWWSFALSLLVAGWTFDDRFLSRMVHPIAYFMIPLSGAFWTIDVLPQPYRDWMSWNPFAIIFEIGRYGQFESASPKHLDFGYIIAVNAFLSYVGLVAIRRLRRRVHTS